MVRELELVVNGYSKVFFRSYRIQHVNVVTGIVHNGKCSAGSTVRVAEHGIYLDGNSFASSLTIPETLSCLHAENVGSCCHL